MPDIHELEVTLTLAGPVLTRSSAMGTFGVDTPVARDRQNRPLLAGSLVKGKLRDAWRELATVGADLSEDTIAKWLGPVVPQDHFQYERARVHISDFVSETGGSDVRIRIRIDPEMGAAHESALQCLEVPFAPGETVKFRGTISYVPENDAEAEQIERWIRAGLRWVPNFGGMRTAGFGRLLDVEARSRLVRHRAADTNASYSGAVSVGYLLTVDDPLCIAQHQPDGNLFTSDSTIPGGAVKGALAATWRELLGFPPHGPVGPANRTGRKSKEEQDCGGGAHPDLWEYFHAIRFRHAFPAAGPAKGPLTSIKRPVTPPLSLVKIKRADRPWYDVLQCDKPVLIPDKQGTCLVPEFDLDWKGNRDVMKAYGWADVKRELRVRTAIDSSRRRAATEELFAYDMVVPDARTVWCGRMDLAAVPEQARRKVMEQLDDLLGHGLRGLGKTKARARIRLIPSGDMPDAQTAKNAIRDNVYAVALQTPALLCYPPAVSASTDEYAMEKAYRAAWSELSHGSLTLKRFFGRVRLAGSEYFRRRFMQGKPYRPYVLTESGSVFLLEPVSGRENSAEEHIDAWRAKGLPLPEWAMNAFARDGLCGSHFSNCPYIPENGYGEIIVNLDAHWSSAPERFVSIDIIDDMADEHA